MATTVPTEAPSIKHQMEKLIESISQEVDRLEKQRDALALALREAPSRVRRKRTTHRTGVTHAAARDASTLLMEQGTMRQADIVDALAVNSGTVSLAMRQLESSGLAEREDVKDRSQVWVWTGPQKGSDEARELTIHAGDGVREGRLKT